jgi:hypothetical protein
VLRGSKAKAHRAEERLEEMESENARLKQELLTTVGQSEDNYQEIRMLRAQVGKLERDQGKQQHVLEAKSGAKQKQLNQQKDREAHILAQIGLLKKDVQTAHEIAQWHKAQSDNAGQERTENLKHALIQAQNATREREEEIRRLLTGQQHSGTQAEAFHTVDEENKRLHHVLGQMEAKLVASREDSSGKDRQALELRSAVQRMEHQTREVTRGSSRQVESLQGEVESLKAQLAVHESGNGHPSSSQRNSNAGSAKEIEGLKIKFSQKLQRLHNKISELENQLAEADGLSDRNADRNSQLKRGAVEQGARVLQLQQELGEIESAKRGAEEEAEYCRKWIGKLKGCVTKLIAHIGLLEHQLSDNELDLPSRPALVL